MIANLKYLFFAVLIYSSLIGLYCTILHFIYTLSPIHSKLVLFFYLVNITAKSTVKGMVENLINQIKENKNES